MYVIKGNRGYVSKQGSKYSYTNNILNARIFKTKEGAESNLCPENETIIDIGYNSILDN